MQAVQFNLGTAPTASQYFSKNAKSLSKEGLREEGFNILKSTITNIGRENVGGLSNINLLKSSSGTNTVNASGGSVNTNSSLYQTKLNQAVANNGVSAGVSGTNKTTSVATGNPTTSKHQQVLVAVNCPVYKQKET